VLRTSDGRLVVVGHPEATSYHPDCTTTRTERTEASCSRTTSWSTRSGPERWSRSSRGVVGWFMVLRAQSFAGHTLSLVGFPGAAGAVWLGVSASFGFFAFCSGCRARDRAAAALDRACVQRGIGRDRTVQAFALACGLLFVSLYQGFLNGITGCCSATFSASPTRRC